MKKVTTTYLRSLKGRGKISAITAYDATFAKLLDGSGVDVILVGDSLGMVIQGHPTTLPVTLDDMLYHTRAVARGARRAHIVGDMPFMSYQAAVEDGVRAAGRFLKEGAAEAVKLEGGGRVAPLVARLVACGIPVMGHIGLTPQSYHQMGGFKVQGRDAVAARALLEDAHALEEAGAYAIVLEGMPRELAAQITQAVAIPTIGIGAGPDCDGQVLVIYDLLGMNDEFRPRFVKRYDQLGMRIRTAVEEYVGEVKDGLFPTEEHSFGAAPPVRHDEATPYAAPGRAVAAAAAPSPPAGSAAPRRSNVLQHPACGWPKSIDGS
jgi:3-methyl-2-oxobutanoate hydroxymethyltransferase